MSASANTRDRLAALRGRLRKIRTAYFCYGLYRRVLFEIRATAGTLWWLLQKPVIRRWESVPPPRLRHRVCGSLDQDRFLSSGLAGYESLAGILHEHRLSADTDLAVLDFGCGSGRILSHFFRARPNWTYFATDTDATAIAWNESVFGNQANWNNNAVKPPLIYEDDAFDVIFAISIFTHLDEEMQFSWLNEFKRILKAGGILIATTHGRFIWGDNPDWSRKVEQSGICFMPTNEGVRNLARTPAHYQTTLHSKDYVLENWSTVFPQIEYIEQGLANTQDAVILGK